MRALPRIGVIEAAVFENEGALAVFCASTQGWNSKGLRRSGVNSTGRKCG